MGYPHIQDLPSELVLKIVTLNANMFVDSDALQTTYAATGVCKSWRYLLLATPSLWGKLIDINTLWRHLDTYLVEILRRSQGSLLWVKHEQGYYSSQEVQYLGRFITDLERLWPRIQILLLVFSTRATNSDHFCNTFSLPAPNIHTFIVTFNDRLPDQPVLNKLKSTTLFSGDAPNLRILKTNWCPLPTFDRVSAPVQGLHSVNIQDVYDAHELLSLLKGIPSLRILIANLHEHFKDSFAAPLAIVSLPQLLSLQLRNTTSENATVLFDHLDLPAGVSLHFQITNLTYDLNRRFSIWLSSFSRGYFKAHPPKRLSLAVSENSIQLIDLSFPEDEKRNFCVSISRSNGGATDVLDVLSSPYLSSTTSLRIETWSRTQPPSTAKLFFAFIPGVTHIEMSPEALQYLALDLQKQFDFCPALTTFAITKAPFFTPTLYPTGALSFLQLRALAGHPLAVFDITRLKASDIINTVRTLDVEELTDMRIRWKIDGGPVTDFICGSGTPRPRLDSF